MYVSKHHALDDSEAIFGLVEAHPLGAWVCHTAGGLVANHVPFLLDRSRGEFGTLVGHVSRANPIWRALGAAAPSVVMFRGRRPTSRPGGTRARRPTARSCPPGTTQWRMRTASRARWTTGTGCWTC